MSSSIDDDFQEELIAYVAKGLVVPIVGKDLLSWDSPEGRTMLYPMLANRLAEKLGLGSCDSGEEWTFESVFRVWRSNDLPGRSTGRSNLYWRVQQVLGEMKPTPPVSLRLLAQIRGFRVLVSTTFDRLLEQAVREERPDGVRVLKFSPALRPAPPDDLWQEGRSHIIQLFGQVSESQDYAVTDGDLLEFSHALQSEALEPGGLLSAFQGRHLLFLGNSFPDWMERFFVRTAKAARLAVGREGGRREIVADAEVRRNAGLANFFTQFPESMDVITSMDATEFIQRLHTRIREHHPEMLRDESVLGTEESPSSCDVFLSYTMADREAVLEIKRRLEARHLSVWCDTTGIEPGANLRDRIRRGIEGCYAFVPVVSQKTETRARSWFHEEWDMALAERKKTARSLGYFFPVFLQPEIRETGRLVPDEFRKEILAVDAPGGEVSAAFVEAVVQLVRLRKQLDLARA